MPSEEATPSGLIGPELFRLDGRVAIVTGAGSGLGLAMARGLAAAGARVVVADVDLPSAEVTADGIAAAGGQAIAVTVDVTDEEQVRATVRRVLDDWRRVDVLVNSAGIGSRGMAAEYELEPFRRVLEVNLIGTFLCCREAARPMLEAGDGRILNVASIAGLVGYPGHPPYIASKGGIVQLTRALAVEWATRGVRVNALAPGVVETPLVARAAAREPEFYEAFRARHPVGRFGRPEEVVGPALFLCSDASSFVTGHILAVDGGFTAQ